MRIRFIGIFVLVLAIFMVVPLGLSAKAEGKRFIAHTDEEVSLALEAGCRFVKEVRGGLKVLACSEVSISARSAVSELNLQEDIRVFAIDSGANTQIKADLVHTGGNTGAGRKIAVLDTGYNYNHPELNSSYLGGFDFVNNDSDPLDDQGHGSHVSGIITADGVSLNARGVAPDAGILALKVLDEAGSGYFSDVVDAIYYAVDGSDGVFGSGDETGVDAVSMSLGTSPPYTYFGSCNTVLPDLTNAIKYAVNKGVLVVAAAGNNGRRGVSIPGCISLSTTVGAVDKFDKLASFSGRGSVVDIVAPGVNIFSSYLGDSYVYASGTSMSTPMVSGAVALIRFSHPSYTQAQVESALFKTAKDLGASGKDKLYGWGRVDAFGAVNYVA